MPVFYKYKNVLTTKFYESHRIHLPPIRRLNKLAEYLVSGTNSDESAVCCEPILVERSLTAYLNDSYFNKQNVLEGHPQWFKFPNGQTTFDL